MVWGIMIQLSTCVVMIIFRASNSSTLTYISFLFCAQARTLQLEVQLVDDRILERNGQ